MISLTQLDRNASIMEVLSSNSYFIGLNTNTLKMIAQLMVEQRAEKNEIIYLEQDSAKTVYFVISGQIKLFKMTKEGKEQIVRLACPGDSFGHTGIFNGGSNPESAQAMIQSVLFKLAKNDLENLLWEHKLLALNTIRTMATEMHHYISLIEDLSLRHVRDRLARLLLQYSSEGVFDKSLVLTQKDMASMTGTVREVFGKSLKIFEENGIVESNRHQIIIKDMDTLKTMAGAA